MVNESVITKIRAMLNMTTDKGCTEAEAQLALERAQALLLQHNLTIASVRDDGTTEAPQGIGCIDLVENHGYSWKRYLMSTLSRANLCKIVVSPSKNQIHLFGSYDNVKSVLEMYNWLIIELTRLAIKALREYKDKGGYENARSFNTGFYAGAISAINERLTKPMADFRAGAGSAIVVYNDKALADAVKKVFPILGHSSSRIGGGYAGQSAGISAGRSMNLSRQGQLSGTLRLAAGY